MADPNPKFSTMLSRHDVSIEVQPNNKPMLSRLDIGPASIYLIQLRSILQSALDVLNMVQS